MLGIPLPQAGHRSCLSGDLALGQGEARPVALNVKPVLVVERSFDAALDERCRRVETPPLGGACLDVLASPRGPRSHLPVRKVVLNAPEPTLTLKRLLLFLHDLHVHESDEEVGVAHFATQLVDEKENQRVQHDLTVWVHSGLGGSPRDETRLPTRAHSPVALKPPSWSGLAISLVDQADSGLHVRASPRTWSQERVLARRRLSSYSCRRCRRSWPWDGSAGIQLCFSCGFVNEPPGHWSTTAPPAGYHYRNGGFYRGASRAGLASPPFAPAVQDCPACGASSSHRAWREESAGPSGEQFMMGLGAVARIRNIKPLWPQRSQVPRPSRQVPRCSRGPMPGRSTSSD